MSIKVTGDFDFHLHREAIAASPGENVFISPTSITTCFAMALNGARGATKATMAQVLGLPSNASFKEINAYFAGVLESLRKADPKVDLAIANSLWGRKGVEFKKPFLSRNKDSYAARITELDFDDVAGSLKVINGWVSENTREKIPSIVDDIPAAAFLYLINAVYMKAPWTVEFDKSLTQDRVFNLDGGKTKSHPTMMRRDDMDYLETSTFQAVRLPYGSGRLSFYVFLPTKECGMKAFHQTLTSSNWNGWMSDFESVEGTLLLPRFKSEYELTLNDPLIALGMGIAFDSQRADFMGMAKPRFGGNFCIGEAKHKTFVDVTEEGTEAAAVTSIGMIECTSIRMPKRTFFMNVDRPFFCAIRDDKTGTNLFLGTIVEPK